MFIFANISKFIDKIPDMQKILETIGNTPLVKLEKISKKYGAEIYAKLEYFNPKASIKDRIVNYIIDKTD